MPLETSRSPCLMGPINEKFVLVVPFHNARSIMFCKDVRRTLDKLSIITQNGQKTFLDEWNGVAPSVFMNNVSELSLAKTSSLLSKTRVNWSRKFNTSKPSAIFLDLRWCKSIGTEFGLGRNRLKSFKSSRIALSASVWRTTTSRIDFSKDYGNIRFFIQKSSSSDEDSDLSERKSALASWGNVISKKLERCRGVERRWFSAALVISSFSGLLSPLSKKHTSSDTSSLQKDDSDSELLSAKELERLKHVSFTFFTLNGTVSSKNTH